MEVGSGEASPSAGRVATELTVVDDVKRWVITAMFAQALANSTTVGKGMVKKKDEEMTVTLRRIRLNKAERRLGVERRVEAGLPLKTKSE